MKNRREFLKAMLGLTAYPGLAFKAYAATAASGTKAKPATTSAAPSKYKLGEWTGDDFTLGHKFRNGELPANFPKQPESTHDFVIVGGGIGGLSTAYYLRDHDFVLLEQYGELGGQARGATFKGIDYSLGSAYTSNVEGIYGALYQDLGIKAEKIPLGDFTFRLNKQWVHGLKGEDKDGFYAGIKQLKLQFDAVIKTLPSEDRPEDMDTPDARKLDETKFSDLLKGYSPAFMGFIESMMKSATCSSLTRLSAAAGIFMTQDLYEDIYCFKGGNPAISKALVKKLKEGGQDRLQSGTFVWKMELNETGCDIYYTSKDGQPHHVRCKQLIVATPPMVAWRQITNLDDQMKAHLMPFQYGSYMVANFLLNKKVFKGAYDNFVAAPFSFCDFVIAETPYEKAGVHSHDGASVLTVYQPWEPGTAGRPFLLGGDREALSKVLHDELNTLAEHLDEHLEEIALTRWGHAMVVPTTGHYGRLRKIMSGYNGPYSFAHSSMQGLPGVENAIRAGKLASERALKASAKTSMLVPTI